MVLAWKWRQLKARLSAESVATGGKILKGQMSNKKKNIYDRVPRGKAILSYYRLWVDGKADAASQGNPFLVKSDAEETSPKSEGKDNGSVVGCNLNNWNANASVRT